MKWVRGALGGELLAPLTVKIRIAHPDDAKRYRQTVAMQKLAERYRSMAIADIIETIEAMHNTQRLDITVAERIFTVIAFEIFSRSPFPAPTTSRLLKMLAWEEFRKYKSRDAAIRIIRSIQQNPWQQHIPDLQEHLAWLQEEAKTKETYYVRDVLIEKRVVEDFIALCANYYAPRHGNVVEERTYD